MSSLESASGSQLEYRGNELELFELAANWKRYWARRVRPYLGRSVIEVGAGLGANTAFLCSDQRSWLSIEPDRVLAEELARRIEDGRLPACCHAFNGVLADIPVSVVADTVLYVDVLDELEHDEAEFQLAASHLESGGHLIVLGPAHQLFYTAFDKAIGHYRRYDRRSYSRLTHPLLKPIRMEYLDSVGMLATVANKWLLRSSMPSPRQIRVWDAILVRASVILDPLLDRRVGKSILGVWKRL